MVNSKNRRFKVNPVEIGVFAIVAMIFLNSVYHLFYDWKGFEPQKVSFTDNFKNRSPASLMPGTTDARTNVGQKMGYENVEIGCASQVKHDTIAPRVRLNGPICGHEPGKTNSNFVKTEITNNANKSHATVFSDITEGTYLTDYIVLNQGENPVSIRFHFNSNGEPKIVSQELIITKK